MKEKLNQTLTKIKGLNVGTVNMWINLIGFIFSVVFYINYHTKSNAQSLPVKTDTSAYRDSVRKINWELHYRIKSLQYKQDSLMQQLKQSKSSYQENNQKVKTVRSTIQTTIKTDWENLSKREQQVYILDYIKNN
jgi:hypothetical protein